jgi:N12 class adenine-specific DNA methylase
MSDLHGLIFQVPQHGFTEWATADEYLSGNVRAKLHIAEEYAKEDEQYSPNVHALKAVQPEDLEANEISVRLGTPWIPVEDYNGFVYSLLKTPERLRDRLKVEYSPHTGNWNIADLHCDYDNSFAQNTYGTARVSAYELIEDSLNQRDTRVTDPQKDTHGHITYTLNRPETLAAQEKQAAINEAFKDWIFADRERRLRLLKYYNENFNCIRPRTFDGSFLTFPGMAPEIKLLPHQLNAVARMVYGGNTLLAHCVGAGKTFEIAAAIMKMRQLGLVQKPVIVVPNHLLEQWSSEFLRLFPAANLLLATERDFEKSRRRRFCSRIATGNFDAVIIGHSSFEKIPISDERHIAILEGQRDEIMAGIAMAKDDKGERWTIKQMESARKRINARLERLQNLTRKDNVVCFEETGADAIFVDESQAYKNLFAFTKMRNVAGMAQSEAQRSQDMFMKTQYLNEMTPGRGVVFASGTPISNSMIEMFTLQKYMQYDLLCRLGLNQFDDWASTFGERVTCIELSPEGTGYRTRTRFAKFYNLPELISMFRSFADIQTADMLNLPVPEAIRRTVELEPTQMQLDLIQGFAKRAEAVHTGRVKPNEDNMLKIVNDGRKLALDQRLYDALFPESETSKVRAAAETIHQIWGESKESRSTQALFCDMSAPKSRDEFSVYYDLKDKLLAKGIPEKDIAFIHEANTDRQKADLFTKVRSGAVRVILGSTQKMGAGTNMQTRLLALHHLDIGWRPSDLEQREGRIIRRGNENPQAYIYRYITRSTFDAYMWQILEQKQRFISQIMTSRSVARTCEDIDETMISFAELKALAVGDPTIKERMELQLEVTRLSTLKSQHNNARYRLEDDINLRYPGIIAEYTQLIGQLEGDIATMEANPPADFAITVDSRDYDSRAQAGEAVLARKEDVPASGKSLEIGEFRGFTLSLRLGSMFMGMGTKMVLKGQTAHTAPLSDSPHGNMIKLENILAGLPKELESCRNKLAEAQEQLEGMKEQLDKPFAHEAALAKKQARLVELDHLLSMDAPAVSGETLVDEVETENEEFEELEYEM